jgi:hypothetical protein
LAQERDQILDRAGTMERGGLELWGAVYLAAINAAIWQREDEIRATDNLEEAGKIGKEIASLNDLRAHCAEDEKLYR